MRISKAQLLIETLSTQLWQDTGLVDKEHLPPGVTQVHGDPDYQVHDHSDFEPVNVPGWNKGPTDWQSSMPPGLTLRGSRGFVHMSAERSDGSPECADDYNPTGHHKRPIRLAERLLITNERLDGYYKPRLQDGSPSQGDHSDGVPNELSLKGTGGYSYQGTKAYQGNGRYFDNGMKQTRS